MKTLIRNTLIVLALTLLYIPEAQSMKITFYGKGGLVIDPDGSRHYCPHFAFRKCCTVEMSLSDLWNQIFAPGSQGGNNGNINAVLPLNGIITVFDDNGNVSQVNNVTITWVDMTDATIDTDNEEITLPSSNSIIIN